MRKILDLLTFPIKWFWQEHEKYKNANDIVSIICLFIFSLAGVGLIAISAIWGISYILNNHPSWVLIAGAIVWLYLYVKSKMTIPAATQTTVDTNLQIKTEVAESNYPYMRNVMYQTLKEIAPNIGGNIPRIISEIEMAECHFIISHNITFYQWKLAKSDIRTRYTTSDLLAFKDILQASISNMIDAGMFPSLDISAYKTKYGNVLCGICVDIIEDVDSHLIIQTVFTSPEYADYLHNKELNQQNNTPTSSMPTEKWIDDEFDI